MEEFVQEFRKVARESSFEEQTLIEKFKRGMNNTVWKKLMEKKQPP